MFRNDMTKQLEVYLKTEKALLEKKDRINDKLLKDFDKAKAKWDKAFERHNNYISYLRARNFNPHGI